MKSVPPPSSPVRLRHGFNFLRPLMKLLTVLIATLLALSLNAGPSENLAPNKVHDSKPDHKEPGDKETGKPDKDNDRDKDDHHDPDDCDDDRHDHGKPKPPKPPKPPKDDAIIPTAPTQLIAEAVSEFQVNLIWVDNSTNEFGFKIERSLDGMNYAQVAQVLPNTTVYRDLNRFPDTKYFYRARAFNAKGDSAYSSIARVQTPAPDCELALFGLGSGLLPDGLSNLVAVAAGGGLSTALRRDGSVVSWQDYLGLTDLNRLSLTNVVAIASGQDHGLALRANGTVHGWGQNTSGQIDIPSGLSDVVAIAAGSYHSLALRADGTVVTWGYGNYGQWGALDGLTGVVAIAAGNAHSLALRSDGTVVSWGMRLSPPLQNLDGLTNIVAIAAGEYLGSALHADGHVSTWAYDDRTAIPPPADLTNAVSIGVGSIWNLAIREDRSLASWGYQTLFGFPQNLTRVAAISVFGVNFLALMETPVAPARFATAILATNHVELSWLRPATTPESILIQRATNVTLTYPLGQPLYEGNWADLATVPSNATGYDDQTVLTNQTYWYRLIAQNGCGVSLSSSLAEATIRPPIYRPTLSGQAFADNAILNYSAANGGFTGITIERSSDPDGLLEPWLIVATISSTNLLLPYTNSGLALNSTYWYRAKENNGLGESPYSLPIAVTITAPAAPNSLNAQIGTTNQIILSWWIGGAGDQTGFKIERAIDLDGFPINWAQVEATTNSVGNSYTDTVVGAKGMTCWYRIKSFNVLGDSEYCQPISIKLLSPDVPVLSGQNYGTTAVLNWHLAYFAADTRFQLERTRGENGTPEAWQQIAEGTNLPSDGLVYASYADPGLVVGETYRYRVRISNWLGGSDYSSPVSVTILPPAAPSLGSIGVGRSNYITLNWWMSGAGSPAEVRIERAPDNNFAPGPWAEIANLDNDTPGWPFPGQSSSYYNDSNVIAGAAYWYRLRAVDAAGISDYSTPIRFKVEPPPQLWIISASNFGDEARLYFYYPRIGNYVEGFKIQRATDQNGSPGNWSQIATIPPQYGFYGGGSENYYTNKTLAGGTYWYRVAPFNWAGDATYSPAVAVTIQPPSAGSSLTAQIGNTQQVVLKWSAPWPNDQDGVEIEHAPDLNGAPGNWELIAWVSRTNQPYVSNHYPEYPYFTVTNVLANTTNWYRLRAFNVIGSSTYLGPVEVRTVSPPPVPANLSALNQGPFIGVSWSSDYDYGYVSDFELQRAADDNGSPGAWIQLAIVPGGEPRYFFYNDDALTAGTKYWYRNRARNWLGQSDFSSPVRVSVPPLPVPSISALRIGQTNQVRLDLHVDYYTYGQRGYRIERAADDNGVPGTWSESGSVFGNTSAALSFLDTNVSAFSTNWYRARTIGVVGVSEPSTPRRHSVVPPPPPGFSASTTANRVTLGWNMSFYTDYGFVTGMIIERAPDNNGVPGSWSRINTAAYSTGTFTDTTLPATNGAYWYRLQAFNWIGPGDYQTNVINIQPPNPPNSVAAAVSTTNRVKVTWYSQYPADQEGFKVERAPDVNGQPGDWAQLGQFSDTGSYFHGFVDPNVTAGTTNWYRVRSYTIVGDSQPSPAVSIALVPPPAPGLLAATFANRVDLTWSGDYDRYGLVEAFELERASDTNGVPGAWSKLASLAGAARSYQDGNLPPDARRWYRLRARNWLGYSAYSDPVSATIVPPAGPQWVTALIGDSNQVSLTLQAALPYEQDGFELERAFETNNVPGIWEMLGAVVASNQYATVFVDSNVLAFTTNWYRARAFNAVGNSTNCIPVQLAIVPPPAVGYFTATTFANQARLTWDDAVPNYGRIQGFKVERADDDHGSPGSWMQIADRPVQNPPLYSPWPDPVSHLSLVDSNLTANAAYWYRIRAYNWIGDGTPTYAVRVEILPPAAPTDLRMVVGQTNSVEIEWLAGASNDQEGFLVERAADVNGSPGSWTEIVTVPNNFDSPWPWNQYPHYSDPAVAANTTLWYRVRAYNIIGRSDYCAPARIVLTPPPAPAFYQSSVSSDWVNLGWDAPSSYSYGAVSGYRLERAAGIGSGPGVWNEIASLFSTAYQDSGLAAGQYWYRVKAYNWIGDGTYSSPVSVVVVPPGTPQNLQAVVGTTNQVALGWQSASPYDQDGFQLELAGDVAGMPGSWQLLALVPATNSYSASFTQTNAQAYATNWYRVRAFNRVGFSTYSDPLPFVVAPPPPPLMVGLSQNADRITLDYRSYTSGDVGGFKVERALDEAGTPGGWTPIGLSLATNSFCGWWDSGFSDAGLTLDAGYWYRVHAFNWVGDSDYSSASFRRIAGPATPSTLTLRIGGTNQVEVSWYPRANDIAGYQLERAQNVDGAPTNWQQLITLTNSASYFTDTNIIQGETYWYRVRAFNSLGFSAYNTPASIAVLPPPPPTRLNASRFANTITLNWQSRASFYGNISGFKLERAPDRGGSPGDWSQIRNIPTTYWSDYTAADTNLTANTTYWYRVRSYNWLGDGNYSPATNLTIIPPAAPISLTANRVGNSAIELWWNAASPQDQDGFTMERRTAPASDWAQIAFVPATNHWYSYYTDTNFVPNVTNYYRVRAFNVVGLSSYSATASAMISLPSAVMLPIRPRIESQVPTNHDVLIIWTGTAGTTNVVEAADDLHKAFAPISPNLILNGAGSVTTNFLDVGTLTNSASRFYRIRVVP